MAFLERNANRGSISTGYDVDNSLKLERANSEKLSRTPSSASNSKTWTYSFWVKRTQLGINSYHLEAKGSGDRFFILGFNENDNLLIYDIYSGDYGKVLTMKFRDIAAWYHIVLAIDTTDGTAGNRNKFYVNGVLVTDYVTDYGDFPQNYDTQINKAVVHNIGYRTDINQYASGYQAETCLIDGAALAPTSFGEFDDNGIWKPIDVTELTFGTNGFYQEYESSSALGADTVPGGNSNDYAASNIAAADQATDTPTNNFVTFNPLNPTYASSVISEGATKLKGSGQNTFDNIQTTIGVTKGKWYCELEPEADTAAQNTGWGVVNLDTAVFTGDHYSAAGFWSAGFDDGRLAWHFYNGSGAGTETVNYGTGSGDTAGTIAMAFDLDNGTLKFYIRNTQLSISASSLPAGTYAFYGDVMGTNAPYLRFNFGGYTTNSISSPQSDANGYGTFEYAPPTGYYALCTKNLAEFG